MSLRWGISWTPSAVPRLTQLQSCFKEKSMTGQRWTSGAWVSSSTRWSAGLFLLMDRTSRYSYFVPTLTIIISCHFTPYREIIDTISYCNILWLCDIDKLTFLCTKNALPFLSFRFGKISFWKTYLLLTKAAFVPSKIQQTL